ncbi:MAG: ABC transporter ATP-binding protein [Spirochaetaceae bacterium]|jgi:oligopeptide/dipeptide ABC transporter ATP-binding protein|nr:ABC transporter ATP-binding protein [Spirochaetaceae bacterium]
MVSRNGASQKGDRPLLELRGLVKTYPLGRRGVLRAVDSVSFAVKRGSVFGIVGESGCGKSTLGRMALRLIEPSEGQVFFRGEDITRLSHRELAPLRRSMQMVFQNPFASFNPRIRIHGALTEVCRFYKLSGGEAQKKISRILSAIGLDDDALRRWPGELSGGQLQRLAIARALLSDPELIVADEPLSALDVSVQAQLLNLLSNLRSSFSTAMIFISHDIMAVKYLCDEVGVMYLGKLVEQAPAGELFDNTKHPYTEALIAAVPRPDAAGLPRRLLPGGEPPAPGHSLRGCPFAPRCGIRTEQCLAEAPPLVKAGEDHLVACHLRSP